MGDFLRSDNQCGQNLLRITSRGSALIAELLRLSAVLPEVFLPLEKIKDPEQKKYAPVIFDFQYLRDPEEFEKKIYESTELTDLDMEFQENHSELLDRFYKLFESIWKYQHDFQKFTEDIESGFYIQYSFDTILQEIVGTQLMAEVVYLYGIILLLLEEKVPGYIREKILIAAYRLHGETGLENFESVCKLCRNTGYTPAVNNLEPPKRPKNHPESFFARFPIKPELIRLIIGRLQLDDMYLMANSFPNPDQRSTRLANQAAMLYVILYFAPDILNKQKTTMREIVDKYFQDNWVIATYMGTIIDLTVEWAHYPAAKTALDNVISLPLIKQIHEHNGKQMIRCQEELKELLKEGILQQEYLLDHIQDILQTIRDCNIVLRWRLMHRKCKSLEYRKIIEQHIKPELIVDLLLQTSQLEYIVKSLLQQILTDKQIAWTDGRTLAAEKMTELSEYFTGNKALTKVKRNEDLVNWFQLLATEVSALNLEDNGRHATATGRKIQQLIKALEDVEQFEQVDTNIQIKSFLGEVKEIFVTMIRTVNIQTNVLQILECIADLSYAWQILTDYVEYFQHRIAHDPTSVVLLRATFLKAASMLDIPLVRITAIDSPDAVSVAEYYSGDLVEFVRVVLEIIPISVFKSLGKIVDILTEKLTVIPNRFEAKDLKDYAQLETRRDLAKLTHEVSVFTEGILVMEKTLLGVIQVEPRQILEEGLRRELVRLLSHAMHRTLSFNTYSRAEINENMSKVAKSLDGLKKSIEYLQDYNAISGLKIFQEEFTRVINYYIEQEANRFLKKKTFDNNSNYQSKAIPIPRLVTQNTVVDSEDAHSLTFMGRVMHSLLVLTEPNRTIYAPECSAWYEHSASDVKAAQHQTIETCGIRTFQLLERSIGVIGLRGVNRLLAFRAVHCCNQFMKYYDQHVQKPHRSLLEQIRNFLSPEYKIPENSTRFYTTAIKKLEHLLLPILTYLHKIGQGQLIRRQITFSLQFGCQSDAHLLYQSLDAFQRSVLNDIKRQYTAEYARNQDRPNKAAIENMNNLLGELTQLIEACGLDDPLQKVYVTTTPLEGLPVILFIFLIAYLPKLEYDPNFGALIRKKSKYPIDGIPLIVGISTLLKQFHPSYTNQLFSYLGQYLRAHLQEAFTELEQVANKTSTASFASLEVPRDLVNCLIFLEQFCIYSSIPRATIHEFIPPYIFDALKFSHSISSTQKK